jgi:hypothetical protein
LLVILTEGLAQMFRAIAPLLLAATTMPVHFPAQPAIGRPAEQPAYVIPFELYDNRIYVQVSGPGFGPRRFLIDSGAQVTHFTSELVQEAGLLTAGRVGISGTGTGRIQGAYVAPVTLAIGPLQLAVRRGVSGPAEAVFGSIYSGTGRRFDGVVGYDLFAAYVVEIDYVGRRLRLYRPGTHRPSRTSESIPIRIVDKKPYMTAVLEVGGLTLPSNLHLDTGFGGSFALNSGLVTKAGLIPRSGRTLESSTRGVGGVTPSRIARFEAATLGRLRLSRPVVVLATVHGAGVRSDSDGRIGGALLRRFTVTLDYRSRTLMLDPNEDVTAPFEVDMSGLQLLLEGQSAIVVSRVGEGTPGAEAGVQPGDKLITLDGVPVETKSLADIRDLLRREGQERELIIQRGDRQIRLRLKLRRQL